MSKRGFAEKNVARGFFAVSLALAAVTAGLGALPAQAVAAEAGDAQVTAAAASAAANAESDFTYKNVLGQAVVTGYTGAGGKVEIPSTLGLLPVTGIDDGAFEHNHAITEVVIPEGVTSIGERAFNDCSALTSVTFPSTLTSIGASAFYTCGSLTTVDLGSVGVTSIGDYAFFGCLSLERVSLPGTLKDWGAASFDYSYKLSRVTLGAGIAYVPERAFKDCKALTAVEMPASVKDIGRRAFENCNELATCDLSNVETFGYRAFAGANGALPRLDLTSAKTIEAEAFCYQQKATSVSLPVVEKIGEKAFFGAFTRDEGATVTIDLPASLTDLAEGAFAQSASSLVALNVDAANPAYASQDGVVYTKDGSALLAVPAGHTTADKAFLVPATVTRIGTWAFAGVSGLERVDMGDNVRELGEGAFASCGATSVTLSAALEELPDQAFMRADITSIDVPASVKKIGERAFYGCGNLTSATLREGLQTISAEAFASAGELKALALPASLTGLDATAFTYAEQLGEITVAPGGTYSFADGMLFSDAGTRLVLVFPSAVRDGNVAVPDGVTTIGSLAFGYVAGTCTVRVPDSVTTIEEKGLCYAVGEGQLGFNRTKPLYGTANNQALIDYANENYLAVFSQETPVISAAQVSLAPGETAQLSMTGVLSDVVYASSDNSVARVSNEGLVTGVAGGEADIFAVAGEKYFSAHVTVSGAAATDPYADYTRVTTADEATAWSAANAEYNQPLVANAQSLTGASIYSSENYWAVNSFLEPLAFKAHADENYGAGEYGEFEGIGQNVASELAQFKLHENVVLYSGLEDAEFVVGDGNNLADVVAMAGKEITVKPVLSTSLLQGLADSFRNQTSEKIMLEIYAPKDTTQGADLGAASFVTFEHEVTFAPGTKFYVLDAGVRYADTHSPDGIPMGSTEPQRYMKLVPVTGEEPDPEPEPTPEPDPDPTPDPDPAPAEQKQPAAEKTPAVTGGATPATGDAATTGVAGAAAAGLAAIAAFLRRARSAR